MIKTQINKLKDLTSILLDNATYLGLSDSTVQNMLESALESDPGVSIRKPTYTAETDKDRRCRFYDLMPHHPLPNVSSFINTPSKFGIVSALFGILRREEKGQIKLSN